MFLLFKKYKMGYINKELGKIEKAIERKNISLWKLIEYKYKLQELYDKIIEIGKNNVVSLVMIF